MLTEELERIGLLVSELCSPPVLLPQQDAAEEPETVKFLHVQEFKCQE